jgi:hypothetical protein
MLENKAWQERAQNPCPFTVQEIARSDQGDHQARFKQNTYAHQVLSRVTLISAKTVAEENFCHKAYGALEQKSQLSPNGHEILALSHSARLTALDPRTP